MGRFLEIELGGRLAHLVFELVFHFGALAGEEIASGMDLHQIQLTRHVADAGGRAHLQVGVEAVVIVLLSRVERATTAQVELVPDKVQRAAERARVGEGSKVACAIFGAEAGEGKPRDGIIEIDFEEEKSFVVPETDVVPGAEFLDQLSFEQDCLRLVTHDVHFQVANGVHQCPELGIPAQAPRGLEVLADAPAQVARLAHVNDRAKPVLHEVDTRFVREIADLAADFR